MRHLLHRRRADSFVPGFPGAAPGHGHERDVRSRPDQARARTRAPAGQTLRLTDRPRPAEDAGRPAGGRQPPRARCAHARRYARGRAGSRTRRRGRARPVEVTRAHMPAPGLAWQPGSLFLSVPIAKSKRWPPGRPRARPGWRSDPIRSRRAPPSDWLDRLPRDASYCGGRARHGSRRQERDRRAGQGGTAGGGRGRRAARWPGLRCWRHGGCGRWTTARARPAIGRGRRLAS